MDRNYLVSKEKCSGCEACVNICSIGAITMIQDEDGFYYPRIDSSMCVDCKRCERVCPEKNEVAQLCREPQLYAAINKDENIRMNSSSGGIFYLLAKAVIDKGGIIFGASFNKNFAIEHIFIDNISELDKLQRSKYVQSMIGTTFSECRKFLEQDKWVLFSGTSCQIEGLYRYLGTKKYDKLLTVDLICSGNTSPGIWDSYLKYMEQKFKSKVNEVNFRDKKYGWDRFSLLLKFDSGKIYRRILPNDKWAYFFLHHYAQREICYDCPYKSLNHRADFTLGDFWGVQQEYPELYDDKGLSFVLANSEKSHLFWDNMIGVKTKKIPIYMLEKHNQAIVKGPVRPIDRQAFYEDYKVNEFEFLAQKYVNISRWKESNFLFDSYWRSRIKLGNMYRNIRKALKDR